MSAPPKPKIMLRAKPPQSRPTITIKPKLTETGAPQSKPAVGLVTRDDWIGFATKDLKTFLDQRGHELWCDIERGDDGCLWLRGIILANGDYDSFEEDEEVRDFQMGQRLDIVEEVRAFCHKKCWPELDKAPDDTLFAEDPGSGKDYIGIKTSLPNSSQIEPKITLLG